MDDSIGRFMTEGVHTIARGRTLADAHEMMRVHKIRHLPVLSGGKLIGMVTDRDLALVESLPHVDPQQVTVEDAMSPDVFCIAADTPVAAVARAMAHQRFGSAVITEGSKVVGIFTVVDALRALDFLFSSTSVQRVLHEAMTPSQKTGTS